jgi:nucleotide-binding universal stress UspA family protein
MKRILVALDQSPRTTAVLAHACAIARSTGAELYLFHAVGLPMGLPTDAFRSSPNELVEAWRSEALLDLERRARTLESGLISHAIVRTGSPWAAICEEARHLDVDLVVLGSHGYDALDHLLGTTAAKVVNHCDRSVLVVREPGAARHEKK